MGPISLHTKFEPNLCMHTRATAVFVCTQPFKLLRSALIKLPSKQKSFLHLLSTFHRKGSSRSEHTFGRCGCVKTNCQATTGSPKGSQRPLQELERGACSTPNFQSCKVKSERQKGIICGVTMAKSTSRHIKSSKYLVFGYY